jgi:molecular chaperone GrpE
MEGHSVSHRHSSKSEPSKSVKPPGGQAEPAAVGQSPERAAQAASAASQEAPCAAEGAAADDKTLQPSESLEQLRDELEQARQRVLRCQAELDNYRKRAARDLEDQLRYANISLLRDLLPVLDNIQRALEAAEKSTDGSGLLDGVELVARQMEDVLKRHHCVKIEALNAPFDPHLHHAISQQVSDEHPANTVMLVTQDGSNCSNRLPKIPSASARSAAKTSSAA